MCRILILTGCSLALLIPWGCGAPGVPEGVPEAALETRLSLGMGSGDSCFVFGDIQDACVTRNGTVVVLDGSTCTLSAYSPEGAFLGRTGGRGEGPGEFSDPFCLCALSDGRFLVSDPGLCRVSFLFDDLSLDTIVTGFVPWSPERTSPCAGGSYTGTYRTLDRENSIYGRILARWSGSHEQDALLHESQGPFNIERVRESAEASQIVFASDTLGRIFVAPFSRSEYRISVLNMAGEELYSIQDHREAAPRSEAEIQEEAEAMRRQLQEEGAPPEMVWTPAEYRPLIPMRGMGVDPEGNLWVRDGREETPVFTVYSDSVLVCRATWSPPADEPEGYTVKVTPFGTVAWCPDPMDFPVLHLLEAAYPLLTPEGVL